MRVDLFIAFRYLFAKKSHNVINVISAISSAGMALGTAAIILILSIFNGFSEIIDNNLSDIDASLRIERSDASVFIAEGPAFEALEEIKGVESVSRVLEKNVFLVYDGKQALAYAKGVDEVFVESSRLIEHVVDGEYTLQKGGSPRVGVGAALARELSLRPRFLSKLNIYYPGGNGHLSLVNPVSSMACVQLRPSFLFSISSESDSELLILPVESLRELTGLEEEVSAVELRCDRGQIRSIEKQLRRSLPEGFTVLDRYSQHPSTYKMIRYEKLAIFLILVFIIIIIAFNIFGSLSILRTEKREDCAILGAMGASTGLIHRIFVIEGTLVGLLGSFSGFVLGLILVVLQQQLGIVKMPGGFGLQAYPVVIQASDLALCAICICVISFIIPLLLPSQEPE